MRTVAVEAYGKIHIEDPTFFESPLPEGGRQGYLEIASSTLRMTGSVVFGDVNRQTLTTALPLTMSLDQSIVFSHVSSNDQYYTGVAIVNPNLTEAHVTVEFYNQDGSLGVSTPITIPARRRTSQLLTQIFTALAGEQLYSGYFKVISDIGVTSYSVFGTRDLTLLSAIPPQIVR